MTYSRHATILLAGAVALLVAVVAIGWWASSPENLRKSSLALSMLALSVGCIQQLRRFPKAAPLMLCAAIAGLGFPYLVATAGPMFATSFAVLVVSAWTGIGIARVRTQSRTGVTRSCVKSS